MTLIYNPSLFPTKMVQAKLLKVGALFINKLEPFVFHSYKFTTLKTPLNQNTNIAVVH